MTGPYNRKDGERVCQENRPLDTQRDYREREARLPRQPPSPSFTAIKGCLRAGPGNPALPYCWPPRNDVLVGWLVLTVTIDSTPNGCGVNKKGGVDGSNLRSTHFNFMCVSGFTQKSLLWWSRRGPASRRWVPALRRHRRPRPGGRARSAPAVRRRRGWSFR